MYLLALLCLTSKASLGNEIVAASLSYETAVLFNSSLLTPGVLNFLDDTVRAITSGLDNMFDMGTLSSASTGFSLFGGVLSGPHSSMQLLI